MHHLRLSVVVSSVTFYLLFQQSYPQHSVARLNDLMRSASRKMEKQVTIVTILPIPRSFRRRWTLILINGSLSDRINLLVAFRLNISSAVQLVEARPTCLEFTWMIIRTAVGHKHKSNVKVFEYQ